MYKISRIYIENAGHSLAWYDSLLLDMTDSQTNDPTHSVLSLVNQGGKTTLLSLFFSTFDTAKDRFLQHLSNKSQKFENYFDKNGLPGFIIVEWSLPGDLASPVKTMITGQAVTLNKAGDTFDPDRRFFCFKATRDLTLDNLLSPKLTDHEGRTFNSRDQVSHWLHTMVQKHLGNFSQTQSQQEWRDTLIAEGLDMEMLRHQVDFNRKEGAMDESFLDFKTEADFTRKFLALAMNSEKADIERETVATHCSRFSRRKDRESSRVQLERLKSVFVSFSVAAKTYLESETQRNQAEFDMGVASATLAWRAGECLTKAKEHATLGETQAQAAAAFETEKKKLLQEGVAYKLEQLTRLEAKAKEQQQNADKEVSKATTNISLYQAAEQLADIERQQQAITQLNQAIANANSDIGPFRVAMEQSASLFHGALIAHWQDKIDRADFAGQAAISAKLHAEQLAEEEVVLRDKDTTFAQQETKLKHQINEAQTRYGALQRTGVVEQGELAETASKRLDSETQTLRLRLQELNDRANNKDLELQTIQTELRQLDSEAHDQNTKANVLENEVADAIKLRESLSRNSVLTRAIKADTADPDSGMLEEALGHVLLEAQNKQTETELKLARLKEAETSIQDTGLAGQDPDVLSVVRHLTNAGIPNVSPYPTYLANVLPDETMSLAVILSDPARFMGVKVQNEAHLGRAREALQNYPAVSKPVVVSIATDRPSTASSDLVIVPPQDSSFFNLDAAKESATQLSKHINTVMTEQDSARAQFKAIQEAKAKLEQYLLKYGGDKLIGLQQTAAKMRAHYDTLVSKRQHLEKKQETIRADIRLLREQTKQESAQLSDLGTKVQRVREYLRDFASNSLIWQASLTEANDARAQIKKDITQLKQLQLELGIKRDANIKEELVLKAEAEKLQAEKARLPHVAETKTELLPLDDLRNKFNTAANILNTIEANKTGALVAERDAIQHTLPTLLDKFNRMMEGLSLAEVHECKGVDYPDAIAKAKAQREAATKQAQTASEEKGKASGNLHEFKRQHPVVPSAIMDLKSHDDADLVLLLDMSQEGAAKAQQSELESKRLSNENKDKTTRHKQDGDKFDMQAKAMRELLSETTETFEPDPNLFQTSQELGEQCGQITRAFNTAIRNIGKTKTSAHQAYEKVLRIVREDEFKSVDAELSVTLNNNTWEATVSDYLRIENAIDDRIATVASELATMEQDFERTTVTLLGLVNNAIKLLRRASEAMRLPKNVPMVGDLTVVKMSRVLGTLTEDEKREKLKPYMEEIAANGNIPETGAALATNALMRLVNGRLGLKVLKMVDVIDEQYVPVDKLSHSGAERISMALLLYFVIAKLRQEERAQINKPQGGVLLLDNPFAKATARPIWQAILSLADAMGVQLLIATGIKEYETLSVFRRFLRLAKDKQDNVTGRKHVSVVDFNFKPNMVKEPV